MELKNLEMLLSGLSSSRPGSSRIKLNVKWGQQSKLMVDVNVKITLETFTRIRLIDPPRRESGGSEI